MSLTQVYLGLGSNIERETHLRAGLDALAGFLVDIRCSAVFESQPVGIKSGPFFNLVVSAYTDLPLMELDRRLKFIEADNGRYAPDRKGLPDCAPNRFYAYGVISRLALLAASLELEATDPDA